MTDAHDLAVAKTTDYLLADLAEDFVGIWQLFSGLRESEEPWTDEEISAAAERVLLDLQARGAVFGQLHAVTGDFVPWEDQDGAVARASAEWRAMDRDPTIDEIAWLDRRVSE